MTDKTNELSVEEIEDARTRIEGLSQSVVNALCDMALRAAMNPSVQAGEKLPLIERLRAFPMFFSTDGGTHWYRSTDFDKTCAEAADEIDRLQRELTALQSERGAVVEMGVLNCPFCGNPPHVVTDDSYDGCHVGCNCEHEPSIHLHKDLLEEAKVRWNRRALPPAPDSGDR